MYEKLGRHLTKTLFSQKWGGGLLSPDKKTFYVNIPKNASSFTNSWLVENGWAIFNYKDIPHISTSIEYIAVILRDPVNRWISGFSQYLKSNIIYPPWQTTDRPFTLEDLKCHWPLLERIAIDQVCWFDDHTWPQYYFYEQILPEVERKYFYCNDRLEKTLQQHFSLNPPSDSVRANANISETQDPIMKEIKSLLRETLSDHEYITHIKQILEPDYNILNSRNFIRYQPDK